MVIDTESMKKEKMEPQGIRVVGGHKSGRKANRERKLALLQDVTNLKQSKFSPFFSMFITIMQMGFVFFNWNGFFFNFSG